MDKSGVLFLDSQCRVSQKFCTRNFFWIFSERLLCVQTHAKLQNFIQLSLTFTKLYHIKRHQLMSFLYLTRKIAISLQQYDRFPQTFMTHSMSLEYTAVEIFNLKNPRWRIAVILKIKNRDISWWCRMDLSRALAHSRREWGAEGPQAPSLSLMGSHSLLHSYCVASRLFRSQILILMLVILRESLHRVSVKSDIFQFKSASTHTTALS